jgi:probable HAF family extracellular repeat protein
MRFSGARATASSTLETLPAPFDDTSDACGINKWKRTVGRSCDVDGNCHAVLWQNGAIRDLNELGHADVLVAAFDIDDLGRITGQAFDDETGTFVAFIATPMRR